MRCLSHLLFTLYRAWYMAYVHTPYVCTDYVHSTLGLIVNMFTFSFTARVVMRSYFAIIIFYVCLLTEHFNKRKRENSW